MILVTGASGFVGAHLTRQLSEAGREVRALYRRHQPDEAMKAWPGVQWQRADLLDVFDVEAALEGVSEVYHAAALVSFNPARKAEMIHANQEGTANLVNAALDTDVRKLIHFSSVAALGRNSSGQQVNEEAQWEESRLNSAYGLSKYAAEMEVWRGIGEGLCAAIVNPGIILGEPLRANGWKEGAPALMRLAYKEFPYYTQGVNGFVDVQDVVRAAQMLMNSDCEAERYILSAGNYSYREIFSLMAEGLGVRPPRIAAGPLLTGIIWRLSALRAALLSKPATITRETARNAQTKSFYETGKLLKALPDFQFTALRETILRMAAAFPKTSLN